MIGGWRVGDWYCMCYRKYSWVFISHLVGFVGHAALLVSLLAYCLVCMAVNLEEALWFGYYYSYFLLLVLVWVGGWVLLCASVLYGITKRSKLNYTKP